MLSGEMYNDLTDFRTKAREYAVATTDLYNKSYGQGEELRQKILRILLKSVGTNVYFEPNFRCEFGFNISIGDNFYANFDCIMLDGNRIDIGNNVYIGPRTSIFTANHAINSEERNAGGCYARPVTIKNSVWIGGNVTILPGTTIGMNSIIGAGSVVTHSIPANVIAAGIPCKVIRTITDADKTNYLITEGKL